MIRGFTQVGLAAASFCTQSQVYRYEKGDHLPYPTTLLNIARALKVSTDYLLGLKDEET